MITFTLAEAVAVLDPRPSRRLLAQMIASAGLQPEGYRRTGGRGRPAALYDVDALFQAHAQWHLRSVTTDVA